MGKFRINLLNLFEFERETTAPQAEERAGFNLTQYKQWIDTFENSTETTSVTQESALKFTAVLSATALYSSLEASLPKEILQNSGSGREKIYDDPLYKLLNYRPNPWMNAFAFWELNTMRTLLWGNSYNIISWRKGVPYALSPVHPQYVEVDVNGDLLYKITGTGDKNTDGTYKAKDILHFKDVSLDGVIGKSRIILAKRAIGMGLAAEKFGGDLFERGSVSRGHYEMPGILGDQAYNRLKNQLNNKENHSTPILEEGLTFKPSMIEPEAAQFIESRQFQIQDVARIFHIPNHLVGDLSKATFSNIEHQDISFVKYGLRPLSKRMEHELEYKLLPGDLGKKYVRFNLDGILRGDTATRADYLTKMVTSKIMNRNEARAIENLNPVPGGEVFENPNTSNNNNNEQD